MRLENSLESLFKPMLICSTKLGPHILTSMDEMLVDFQEESKGLVEELVDILDEVEGEYENRSQLEKFGQVVDRIMGGAQSLEMALDEPSVGLSMIGKYAQICKTVGYKASQIDDNEEFYNIVVAFLLDANEMLESLVDNLGDDSNAQSTMSETFLDRLKWISGQFKEGMRASVAVEGDKPAGNSQADIDALLKSLGV